MSIACFAGEPKSAAPAAAYAQWISEMKTVPRGPFRRVRWFCQDGQVLPPKSYACADFGGGSQHGEWSERTVTLRKTGYFVANVISYLDALLVNDPTSEHLAQMLIEQFLLRVDDGRILRQARFYRGAFQEEGERRGARKLLLKMAKEHG